MHFFARIVAGAAVSIACVACGPSASEDAESEDSGTETSGREVSETEELSATELARRQREARIAETVISPPEDPWSLPAPEVTQTLVFFPPRDAEGNVPHRHLHFNQALLQPWEVVAPQQVSVIPEAWITKTLREAVYRYAPELTLSDRDAETLQRFWGATHVVHGTMQDPDEEEGTLEIEVTLLTDDGEMRETFSRNSGEYYFLAGDVNTWLVEEAGLDLSDEEALLLAQPPFGDHLPNWFCEEGKAMEASSQAPEWTELRPADPPAPMYEFWYTETRRREGMPFEELDPGPQEPDAPYWQRRLRVALMRNVGRHDQARQEVRRLLATHPGSMKDFITAFYERGDGVDLTSEDIAVLEQWAERAPETPLTKAVRGEVYRDTAWDYRGTSWARDVDPNAWKYFQGYGEEAITLFNEALDDTGEPVTWVSALLVGLEGAIGSTSRAYTLVRDSERRWPEYAQPRSNLINFLRPRWGGSHLQAMAAIEEGMQANPDNWFFTFHARDYHMEEARILLPDDASNTEIWYKLRTWAEDYPPAHQQLRRASLRGARCDYQPGTLLYSLGTALRLDDDELVEDLLTEHPDVDFWIADEGWEDHNWRGKIITGAWWTYYALDNDEQLGELTDYALEYNETLRSEGEHTYDWYLGFGNQMHVPLYRALTLAETGDVEEARAMMADFKPQGEFQRLYRDWLVLYTADDMEEELTHLARGSVLLLHTQNPDNPAAKALFALHQHRLGLTEEARAIVDSITEPPEDWIFGNGNLGSIERRLRAELGMGEREENAQDV